MIAIRFHINDTEPRLNNNHLNEGRFDATIETKEVYAIFIQVKKNK